MQHWTWIVLYEDGTEGWEDDLGTFAKVDINRVTALIVQDRNDVNQNYVVHIKPGMRPIFFRRTRRLELLDPETIPVEYFDADGNLQETYLFATVLGWQKTVAGHNVKSLTWLLHDGSVVVTDRDLDEIHADRQ